MRIVHHTQKCTVLYCHVHFTSFGQSCTSSHCLLCTTMDKSRDKGGLGQSLLHPMFYSPDAVPTTDTSPQSLGLHSSVDDLDKAPDLSASSRVRRVVEKTVDKLGRSKSAGPKAQPTSPRRSMFSLHRPRGSKDMTPGSFKRIYLRETHNPNLLQIPLECVT